jgi:hypothetical protein
MTDRDPRLHVVHVVHAFASALQVAMDSLVN